MGRREDRFTVKLILDSSRFLQGFLLKIVDILGCDSIAQGDFASLKGNNSLLKWDNINDHLPIDDHLLSLTK